VIPLVLMIAASGPPGLPVARVAAALTFTVVLSGLLFALGSARQRAQRAEVNLELEADFQRLEREFAAESHAANASSIEARRGS